jgi:hypothetical protein
MTWDDDDKAEPVTPPTVRATIPVRQGSGPGVHLALAITGGAVRPALHSVGRALCDRSSVHRPHLTDCPDEQVTCGRCIQIAGLSMAIVGATTG